MTVDIGILKGLGQLHGSLGEAQSKACRDAVVEIQRLQAIVDRLPKTADGVPVVPGDELWCVDSDDGWEGMITVRDVECVGTYGKETSRWLVRSTGRNELWVEDCYSTREAAEAARAEVGE